MRGLHLLLSLALILQNVGPAEAGCLRANADWQSARGRLTTARAHDAAGRPETPYILELDVAICLQAEDPDEAVGSARTMQVFPDDEKLAPAFRRLIGKMVTVRGNPFAAMTAHHHAPIVMGVTEIEPR
jgi:hypothetical protein